MLRFAEEVLLLLLDEERGDITTRISTHTLNVVLSGAVLMDLALEGHIDTDPRQLVVTDPTPTGDSLLDFALNDMMLDTEIHDAGYWIRYFARQGNAIRRRVLRRLVKTQCHRVGNRGADSAVPAGLPLPPLPNGRWIVGGGGAAAHHADPVQR